MSLIVRLRNFVKRNKGVVLRKAFDQAAVRLWVDFRLWKIFGGVLRVREPKTWVFMGGCYNSGTTILREIIGSHPEVASLPREGVEMTDAFPDLEQNGWVRMWFRNAEVADLSDRDPRKMAERAMRHWSIWWKRGADVFLEKSIVHGAWMPVLEKGFTNARFIGVIRNGYCVCEGIRRRAAPTGPAREVIGSETYPIQEVGKQWNFANEVLQRDKASVAQYHEIHYEAFAENPTEHIREIFRFIGVDDSLVSANDDGTVQVGERSFNIRNQNDASLARLSPEDRTALYQTIGPMMDRLGYPEAEGAVDA